MIQNISVDTLASRRERLSQLMVLILPGFGRWASTMRDFETPYGKAGIRQLEVLYMLRHDLLDPTVPAIQALPSGRRFHVEHGVLTRLL